MSGVVVRAQGLNVDFVVGGALRRVIHDLDLRIEEGEALGLVGASGSGKSTVALSLTRFLPRGAVLRSRRLEVAGKDLLALGADDLRRYRQRDIGVVYQEPARALNPTARVGDQVAEVHSLAGGGRRGAVQSAVESLAEAGLENPDEIAHRYPHELSGGQQQRVMIAMALAVRPRLLILDEPTTALDALARKEVLELIARLRAQQRFAILLVSHDLPLVASLCDRASVLSHGRLVETVPAANLIAPSAHPRVQLTAAGSSGSLTRQTRRPRPLSPILVASGLSRQYGSWKALDDVDLRLGRGETLGVVGETGSGKTTLGRAIAGVIDYAGSVEIDAPRTPRPVQMVFQSPEASLNPSRTVRQTLAGAIRLLRGNETPTQLAHRTRLPLDVLDRLPHELSGGQKQRVAIARAFAGSAPIIVCDEPTSALDADVQTEILDLLIELQERTGVSYLFISHDLSVVARMAHRVAVMRAGRILETAPSAALFAEATHDYTRELIAASSFARKIDVASPAEEEW